MVQGGVMPRRPGGDGWEQFEQRHHLAVKPRFERDLAKRAPEVPRSDLVL